MTSPYASYIRDEMDAEIIYRKLAEREKKPENRAVLLHLAEQEAGHHKFWQALAPEAKVSPHRLFINAILLLRTIFGVTFTVKFLELHEKDVVAIYGGELPGIKDPARRDELVRIIKEEEEHERAFMGQLKERRVAYVGFIALGLADAIVEITGVHAGFLGITGSTLVAGISGLTVGFAAAISMGSAAYIQAKQDPEKSAVVSAVTTGVTYLLSVVLLALPYFFTHVMPLAFGVSTTVGLVLLAMLIFYSSVIFDKKFVREFAESAALMLGTAVATFFFGELVGRISGVNQKSF